MVNSTSKPGDGQAPFSNNGQPSTKPLTVCAADVVPKGPEELKAWWARARAVQEERWRRPRPKPFTPKEWKALIDAFRQPPEVPFTLVVEDIDDILWIKENHEHFGVEVLLAMDLQRRHHCCQDKAIVIPSKESPTGRQRAKDLARIAFDRGAKDVLCVPMAGLGTKFNTIKDWCGAHGAEGEYLRGPFCHFLGVISSKHFEWGPDGPKVIGGNESRKGQQAKASQPGGSGPDGGAAAGQGKKEQKAPWKSRAQIEEEKRAAEEQAFDKLLETYKPSTFRATAEKIGKIEHLWPNWLVLGEMSMIFSRPKTGKTRLYLSLAKSLWNKEPFPDGAENSSPAGSKILVLPYDRNHVEIDADLEAAGIPPEAVQYPPDPRDPSGLTLMPITDPLMVKLLDKTLANDQTFRLIAVDTLTYASQRSLCKPEDMKILLDPIMTLAQKHKRALLVLCHENKEGDALGLRIKERARVICRLERISEEDPSRLRLYVKDTNFAERPSVIMVHETTGVRFEKAPDKPAPAADRRDDCARWLVEFFWERPKPVDVFADPFPCESVEIDYGTLIDELGAAGFAGTFDPDKGRWSNTSLMGRAIKALNAKAKSLSDCHAHTITRREEVRFGRGKSVIYYAMVSTAPEL